MKKILFFTKVFSLFGVFGLGLILPTQVHAQATTTATGTPIISSVVATSTASTSAVVTWFTDQPADSKIDYGTNMFYGASTSAPTLTTNHSQALFGLIPDTQYHFFITSTNASGTSATTSDQVFLTLGANNGTSTATTTAATGTPVISSLIATSTTSTSENISWTTNQPTTSKIDYGTNIFYGASTSDMTLSTSHLVTLFGLSLGTEYHFFISSTNASGTSATTSDQVFVTSGTSTATSTATTTVSNPTNTSSGGAMGRAGGRRHPIYASTQNPTQTYVFIVNLSKGMRNNYVIDLQNFLRNLGYFTYPVSTGYFGPVTLQAVQMFQVTHSVPGTGFVGPLTRAALNSLNK